jgi:hypothetical protein
MQWTELSQESAAVHFEYGPISLKGLHVVMARLANAINLRILFMVTVGTMFGRGLSLTLKTRREQVCFDSAARSVQQVSPHGDGDAVSQFQSGCREGACAMFLNVAPNRLTLVTRPRQAACRQYHAMSPERQCPCTTNTVHFTFDQVKAHFRAIAQHVGVNE